MTEFQQRTAFLLNLAQLSVKKEHAMNIPEYPTVIVTEVSVWTDEELETIKQQLLKELL